MSSFDWDDLRIFLAAARAGSLTLAAGRLGVDAATVGRRVSRLESALKSTLLTRSASGLALTSSGVRLHEIALAAESAIATATDAAVADAIGGTVRLSVAEGFGGAILAPALGDLRLQYSGLRIELAANAGFLSLARREVDMAVTLSAPSEARLVVEPLTDYQLALYASPAYLDRCGAPERTADLVRRELVGYIDDLIYAPQLRYLNEVHAGLQPILSSTSIRAQREIILSGAGLGVLPCFMSQGLVRVLEREVLFTRQFWVSTHRDVAGTARVRAVGRWLATLVRRRQQDLMPY